MKNTAKERKRGRPKSPLVPNSIFGKKLRKLQGDKKNIEIQEIMGIGSSAYLTYLSGERFPDARSLQSLHKKTNVDLNWLLNDDDKTPDNEWPVLVQVESRLNAETENLKSELKIKNKLIEQLETANNSLIRTNELLEEKLEGKKKSDLKQRGA
jgi:transcriptional regulator with XRE-family HTH domain